MGHTARRRGLWRGVKAFVRRSDGGISILSALFMTLLMAAGGFALDMGSLRLEKLEAQSAVDLAAIAAASNMPKRDAAASGSIKANHISRVSKIIVTPGRFTADSSIAPSARFVANATPTNAVQVQLTKTGRQYFSQLFAKGPMTINVIGTAAATAEATFSLGTRMLGVHDGVPNRLMSAALGGSVNLSVNDYNALAGADISLLSFLNALAVETHVTAGSYSDVIKSSADVGDVLNAIATVAGANGNVAAVTAAKLLASQSHASNVSIPLAKLLGLGNSGNASLGQSSPGLTSTFKALDLINASSAVANTNKLLTVDLGATVPGVASLKVDIISGEPPSQSPWVVVGQREATLYSAATRLRILAEVGGTGALAGVKLKLPIYIATPSARARLAEINCAGGDVSQATVTIGAKPGVAEAWIGEVSNTAFAKTTEAPTVSEATIFNVLLFAKVTASAHISAGGITEKFLVFGPQDIKYQKIMSTSSSDIGGALVTTLLANTTFKATILGLGLGTPAAMAALVATQLSAVAAPIDDVVHTLLTSLGVHAGEADIAVHGIRCDGGALVN